MKKRPKPSEELADEAYYTCAMLDESGNDDAEERYKKVILKSLMAILTRLESIGKGVYFTLGFLIALILRAVIASL